MELKYIISSDHLPILFTEGQLHKDFSMFNPISAGFVRLIIVPLSTYHAGVETYKQQIILAEVYGGSDSLGLESRPEDAVLINKLMLQ